MTTPDSTVPWRSEPAPRLAQAWDAIAAAVDAGPAHWTDLMEVAIRNSDLKYRTCENIIYEAVKDGYLLRIGTRGLIRNATFTKAP